MLQFKADLQQQQQLHLAERKARLTRQEDQHAAAVREPCRVLTHSRLCSWHGSQQLKTTEQEDRNNTVAAQQQAAAALCSEQMAFLRQGHISDPASQMQNCSAAMAGVPLAATAAEYEDRNNKVAAQLIEQQQRPLDRSREAKSGEPGPGTSRASPLPAAHTALNLCVFVCARAHAHACVACCAYFTLSTCPSLCTS